MCKAFWSVQSVRTSRITCMYTYCIDNDWPRTMYVVYTGNAVNDESEIRGDRLTRVCRGRDFKILFYCPRRRMRSPFLSSTSRRSWSVLFFSYLCWTKRFSKTQKRRDRSYCFNALKDQNVTVRTPYILLTCTSLIVWVNVLGDFDLNFQCLPNIFPTAAATNALGTWYKAADRRTTCFRFSP